jgi:hypothetical protein
MWFVDSLTLLATLWKFLTYDVFTTALLKGGLALQARPWQRFCMVSRLRLKNMMESELPSLLGICQSDWPRVAAAVNRAQRRLMTCREAGDAGWYGSWAEVVFNVSRNSPYITLPRGIARLIKVNACEYPIEINNQFYEYLTFGNGNLPKSLCGTGTPGCGWSTTGCTDDYVRGFRRNMVCTFSDLVSTNKFLRIYPTHAADATLRVLVGCRDVNGVTQRQLDGPLQVQGLLASLTMPWVDVGLPGISIPLELSAITAIQKDVTLGQVHFYEVDLTTGTQRLILSMEPGETVAAYQCYYLHSLPQGCCSSPTASDDSLVQLKAIVKLDLIPAVVDTDYLLIQSEEAIIAEAQAARFGDMDVPAAKTQAAERHREAVRYLQGQLVHFEGKEQPAISFHPFGSARLENQRIGLIQ